MDKHTVLEENAERFWQWIQRRGGIAIWRSVNLSNPDASWSTPVNEENGDRYNKPNWQSANEPERIITNPSEVEVSVPKEVKRFPVAVRRGSQGLSFKLTDGSTRKVRSAVAKISEEMGKEAWYEFDYSNQEAVIFVDDRLIPLQEYAKEKGWIK